MIKIDPSQAGDSRYIIGVAVALNPDRVAANAVRILGMPSGLSADSGAVADFIDARYQAGADVSAVFDAPPSKDIEVGRGQEKMTIGQILLAVAGGLGIVGGILAGSGQPGSSEAATPPPPPAPKWYQTTGGIIGIVVGSLLLIGGIIYIARKRG